MALASYGHFTSPIRRYPDLAMHRAIKYQLAKEHGNLKDRWTPTGGWHSDFEDMLQLGQHCSMTERRADEATRDVADWLKCDFMLDQVGNVFTGIIASVTGFGFFVRLDDLFIDGLVHVSSLDNDYYRYDNIGQRLIGESSGVVYRLGDTVEIRVDAVHMDERKIDFALVSSTRKPRGEGKTARDKAKITASVHYAVILQVVALHPAHRAVMVRQLRVDKTPTSGEKTGKLRAGQCVPSRCCRG